MESYVCLHMELFLLILTWNYILVGIYLVLVMPKEAGQLNMEYSIYTYTGILPGYIFNWKGSRLNDRITAPINDLHD